MSVERFKDQNYAKLRKHHRELGVPWTDPTFPASDASIGLNKAKKIGRRIEWKRPADLTSNPSLFVGGASSLDATQGKLGNCWFVAACAVLAGSKPLWEKVIPDHKDQEWCPDNEYSGVFRFRFWRFGEWVEVLVDDLLPTEDNELIFTHSANNNEFWSALLEKAYAKLHGTYEVLDGGNLSDALVDFTSGVSEVISIDDEVKGYRTDDPEMKKKLFKIMADELEDHALMCCAIKAATDDDFEKRTDLGLVKGHAYGITAARKLPIGGTGLVTFFKGREKVYLVRLQNPWGAKEWKGPFSDGSPEWNNITEKEREKLGLTFNDDGEFWMPFDDFLHQFTEVSICRTINTSLFSFAKTWSEESKFGAWKAPDRAGGCLNSPDTFINNPQYRFDISKDEDEVIIQLSQEDVRSRVSEQRELQIIGFHIMKVEVNRKYRMHQTQEAVATSDYIKTKHIFLKTKLSKGRYVIVPTTFKPGETTKFLLRMFTDDDADLTELEKEHPVPSWWQCFSSEPELVTRVLVKCATGLENQDTFGKSDPYCIIKCEGKKVRSEVVEGDLSPVWNASAVFYRKDPEKPIKIQVYNHNLVMDSFMGQATVLGESSKMKTHVKELYNRRGKKTERMPGSVTVQIETYNDLDTI